MAWRRPDDKPLSEPLVVGSLAHIHVWVTRPQWVNILWPRRNMMSSSNGNIFRVTGPLCGEFTGPGEFPTQRPVTRSFDVFFDLRPNKRLSKQSWGWWFETPLLSFWRHCNDGRHFADKIFKCILLNENFRILNTISPKYVPLGF